MIPLAGSITKDLSPGQISSDAIISLDIQQFTLFSVSRQSTVLIVTPCTLNFKFEIAKIGCLHRYKNFGKVNRDKRMIWMPILLIRGRLSRQVHKYKVE